MKHIHSLRKQEVVAVEVGVEAYIQGTHCTYSQGSPKVYDKLYMFRNHPNNRSSHMQRDLRNQYTLYSPTEVAVVEEEVLFPMVLHHCYSKCCHMVSRNLQSFQGMDMLVEVVEVVEVEVAVGEEAEAEVGEVVEVQHMG